MKSIIVLFIALSLGTVAQIPIGGGSAYFLKYVEIVISILFFIFLVKHMKKPIRLMINTFDRIYYLFWFLCLIYSMLAFYWSDQPMTALSGSIVLIFGLIGLIIANYFISQNSKIFVTANRILIISLFIQLVINMAQVFGSIGLSFYLMKMQSNTLIGNSNYISFYFTFGLLYELIAKDKGWLLFIVMNLFGVILTISRGAIVSIVVCLAVYVFILIFNRRLKKFGALTSIGLIIIGFFIFINYTVPGNELWSGLQYGLQATSVTKRQFLWDVAMQQIKENPFGNGLVWLNDPHNVFFKTIRDLGVFFGTVFLFLIGYPILHFMKLSIFRLSKKSIAILVAYLSAFAHSFEEVFYFSSTSIIWTVMVLTFLNVTIRNERIQSIKNAKKEIKVTIKNKIA